MEVYLYAGRGMSGGIAGRDDGLQDPAGAVGERVDSDGKEDSAARAQKSCSVAHQDRSVVSPDGESQLSADDHALGAAAAGDGHPLLSGMVSDAVQRPAAVHGLDVFHLQFLPGLAAGAFPSKLAAGVFVSAVSDGTWDWTDHYEHEGGDRSAHRKAKRVCAHAEVPRGNEAGSSWGDQVSEAAGMGPLARIAGWGVFRAYRLLRGGE